jgi:Ca2+/H+ antiporter
MLLWARRFLTGALQDVAAKSGLGQAFLGLIVLPIAGNACEHIVRVHTSSHAACMHASWSHVFARHLLSTCVRCIFM